MLDWEYAGLGTHPLFPHVLGLLMMQVYYSEEIASVELSTIRGKCEVRRKVEDLDTSQGSFDHVFVCDYVHDPKTQTIKHVSHYRSCSNSRTYALFCTCTLSTNPNSMCLNTVASELQAHFFYPTDRSSGQPCYQSQRERKSYS